MSTGCKCKFQHVFHHHKTRALYNCVDETFVGIPISQIARI